MLNTKRTDFESFFEKFCDHEGNSLFRLTNQRIFPLFFGRVSF